MVLAHLHPPSTQSLLTSVLGEAHTIMQLYMQDYPRENIWEGNEKNRLGETEDHDPGLALVKDRRKKGGVGEFGKN